MGHQDAIWLLGSVLDRAAASRGELSFAKCSAKESIAFLRSFQAGYRFVSHLTLACIHDFQGRDDEMLVCLRQAIECDPRRCRIDRIVVPRLSEHASPEQAEPAGRVVGDGMGGGGLAALGRFEDATALRQSTE